MALGFKKDFKGLPGFLCIHAQRILESKAKDISANAVPDGQQRCKTITDGQRLPLPPLRFPRPPSSFSSFSFPFPVPPSFSLLRGILHLLFFLLLLVLLFLPSVSSSSLSFPFSRNGYSENQSRLLLQKPLKRIQREPFGMPSRDL